MALEPPDRLELRATADAAVVADLRNAVTQFAVAAGAPSAVAAAVKLAVSEVLSNVVLHAYIDAPAAGSLMVEVWTSGDALLVRVCDEGRGMKPRPDSPGLGMGLPLVAQLADDFRVEDPGDGPGMRVAMRFSLNASRSVLSA